MWGRAKSLKGENMINLEWFRSIIEWFEHNINENVSGFLKLPYWVQVVCIFSYGFLWGWWSFHDVELYKKTHPQETNVSEDK